MSPLRPWPGFLMLCLLFGGEAVCLGYDDGIMTPVQMMERATFTQKVVLENSPEIYEKFAELVRRGEIVEGVPAEPGWAEISLAWLSNPAADAKVDKFVLPKGISIFAAIQKIAKGRMETVGKRRNFVVIKPSGAKFFHPFGQIGAKKEADASTPLERGVEAVMLTRIILREPEGKGMEDFINLKLQETAALSAGKTVGKKDVFRMDEEAKNTVAKLNVVGIWVYGDLLDAISELTGLRWGIDGNTLWLGRNPESRATTVSAER